MCSLSPPRPPLTSHRPLAMFDVISDLSNMRNKCIRNHIKSMCLFVSISKWSTKSTKRAAGYYFHTYMHVYYYAGVCHPGYCRQRSKSLTRSYRSNMQMSLGHFIGQWLGILRKLSHQKLECEKLLLCNIQGMSARSEIACSMLFVVIVGDIRDGLNYIVYHNSNYSNKETCQINASNYSLFQIKAWYKFELQLLWIRQQLNSLQIVGTSN